MKKRRMVLDLLMIVVIATLYHKNVISLMYHEVVGLVLGLLFVLHLFFNRKWVAGVLKNRANLSGRVRALAWVDILLVVSWLAATITGVLISRKVFQIELEGMWIPLHFFSSAVALLLTAVHIAMHRNFFAQFFKTKLALALLVVLTISGCWGITRLTLGKWFMAPFVSRQEFESHDDIHETQNGAPAPQGERGRGRGHGGHHGKEPFSPVELLQVMFGVISVILVVNAGEYAIEKIIAKRTPACSR